MMDFSAYGYSEVLGKFHQHKQANIFCGREEYGVSSLAFDPQQDLLWSATYGGHLTSFHSSSLNKHTSFRAHHTDVRQLLPTMRGVVSIAEEELRLSSRAGLPILTIKNKKPLTQMNCGLFLDESSLLVGCGTGKIVAVDLSQGQVTKEVKGIKWNLPQHTLHSHAMTNNGVCLMKPSERYLCCGDVTGNVFMSDPTSLQTVAAFPAHMAGMCDMDVVGNYLVTCGLSQRFGQLCVEPQLKVFDLRFLRPMPSCDVTMLQPFLIRCIPAVNSTILVVSQTGEFQTLDLRGLVTPSSMVVNRLKTSSQEVMVCSMDVGPSCHCFGFGDSNGVVHLWSDKDEFVMNPYAAQDTPLPVPDGGPLPFISWDADDRKSAPLSAVAMPLTSHGRSPLFSHWPVGRSKFFRRMTPAIDCGVLENMRSSHFVGYAPKPAHIRRNQVPYDLEKDMRDHVPESPMMRENNPLSLIPKPFRQVEIKYSKLGIETFNFGHYNDTKFAGLEIHIPNAYCNCMLQVLYFLEPLRCAIQKHLCSKEFCLACELGLLFRMLDRSDGVNCQASNFLRAFRTLREASALGLVLSWENEERKINLGKLIQSWIRFVLQQLNQETEPQLRSSSPPILTPTTPSFKSLAKPDTPTTPVIKLGMRSFLNSEIELPWTPGGMTAHLKRLAPTPIIEKLFASTVETAVTCRCGWGTTTQRPELLFSLCYPHNLVPYHMSGRGRGDKNLAHERVSFSSVLQQSICRQQRINSWCDRCNKYKPTTHQKCLCSLPPVLVLNCQVESEQDKEFWHFQQHPQQEPSPAGPTLYRWVPLTIRMSLSEDGELKVTQDPEVGRGRTGRGSCGGSSGHGGSVSASEESVSVSPLRDIAGLSLEGSIDVGAIGGRMVSECGNAYSSLSEDCSAAGATADIELGVPEHFGMQDGDFEEEDDVGSVSPSQPASRGGSISPNQHASRGGSVSPSQPASRGGSISPNQPASRGGSVSSSQPASRGGSPSQPASRGGSVSSSQPASRGGSPSQPASRGGSPSQPASRGGSPGSPSQPASRGGSPSQSASRGGSPSQPASRRVELEEEGAISLSPASRGEGQGCLEEDGSVQEEEDEYDQLSGLEEAIVDGGGEGDVYELTTIVSHVKEPWMETEGNLVAHVRVGPTYHMRKEGQEKTRWYLFNDFHITPVKESEVALFSMEWLTPAILIYTKKGYEKSFSDEVSCQLDPIVLLTETHSPRPVQSPVTFTPLAFTELPSAGDIVGIDAEFVTLNQEEAEVNSDGTHTTLKPSQFSVARITVIRGSGAMEGSPFIDDYISTSEQVVDYLTKFSGIKPGDLDASMSSKHLTTLKASYLKLLYLLENGVKFVGHGLRKDFRVINILVPPEQIIDTVQLFHLPNQRYISLKFLAWFFLNMLVQQGSHDSCEDARTALLLYRKYLELEAKGQVDEMLQKVYDIGRSYNWVIPKP